VNGHDETALDQTLKELLELSSPCPKAIVAHTVKGKGVSFMEDNNVWHYSRLNTEIYAQAKAELEPQV
jgi:transketolase